jgi:hypothetical protein
VCAKRNKKKVLCVMTEQHTSQVLRQEAAVPQSPGSASVEACLSVWNCYDSADVSWPGEHGRCGWQESSRMMIQGGGSAGGCADPGAVQEERGGMALCEGAA